MMRQKRERFSDFLREAQSAFRQSRVPQTRAIGFGNHLAISPIWIIPVSARITHRKNDPERRDPTKARVQGTVFEKTRKRDER